MQEMKHVLNINQNISENDSIIVEDILRDTLLKLKKLKSVEKLHYQINVSYETKNKEVTN
jgi:hypothetical protein